MGFGRRTGWRWVAYGAAFLALGWLWGCSHRYEMRAGYVTHAGAGFWVSTSRGKVLLCWCDLDLAAPMSTGAGFVGKVVHVDPKYYFSPKEPQTDLAGQLKWRELLIHIFGRGNLGEESGFVGARLPRFSPRIAGAPVAELSSWFGGSAAGVEVPWWFLMASTAMPGAVAKGRGWWKSRRRANVAASTGCRHELRVTPGRCPECGTGVLGVGG